MKLRSERLGEDDFLKQREEVLAQWATGRGIDLEEAIAYHKNLPAHKKFVNKLRYAKEHGEIYATTGMGKATIEEQIELLEYVENEGQADILAISVDSLTRQNDYEGAQRGVLESLEKGRSILNGLPVVNHGVGGIRRIVEAVNCPVQPRYGAADPRLSDEILLAGGCSCTAPDVFMSFWHQHSKVPFETVVRTHQYVGRLMGYYEEHGVPMCSGAQGLYGAGVPPSLQSAAVILSLLIQAEQGVKHMHIHCIGHGNLIQDVANANIRRKLVEEYLNKLEYHDREIFLNASFNLMQYPTEHGASFAVVFMNTLMAKLFGAQLNDIRTVAEAKTIPTKEDIAYSFRTAKVMQNLLTTQKIEVDRKQIEIEAQMAEQEVRCIVDKVLELGDGDVVVGAKKAIEAGILDHPFAANRAGLGKVMGVKDSEGAIRYLDPGNLPFTREIVDFHRGKIAAREKAQGKKVDYETVLSDLLSISRGCLVEL